MADKNKNGIPDNLEYKPGQNVKNQGILGTSVKRAPETAKNGATWLTEIFNNPARAGLNFVGDLGRGLMGIPKGSVGTGVGDQLLGTAPGAYADWNSKLPKPKAQAVNNPFGGAVPQQASEQQAQARKTFADYLQEMLGSGMFGSSGGGGYTPVDYSSQRNTLQSNYANNDAKLEAMYRQLSNSIAADAKPLDAAYQGAIDTTRQNGVDAQAQTNAAYNALAAHQAQVAQNLGIQQAQQNSAINGTDVNPQLAGSLTKQASNQQSALDQLASARSAAAANNVNVGTAARQEGTMARSMAQQKLASLLSQIDMQQQNQNAQLAASARSAGSNGLSEALQYAQAMFNADQTQQKQDDLNAYNAQQLALKAQKASPQSQVSIDTILKGLTQRGIQIPSNARDLASLIQATKGLGF